MRNVDEGRTISGRADDESPDSEFASAGVVKGQGRYSTHTHNATHPSNREATPRRPHRRPPPRNRAWARPVPLHRPPRLVDRGRALEELRGDARDSGGAAVALAAGRRAARPAWPAPPRSPHGRRTTAARPPHCRRTTAARPGRHTAPQHGCRTASSSRPPTRGASATPRTAASACGRLRNGLGRPPLRPYSGRLRHPPPSAVSAPPPPTCAASARLRPKSAFRPNRNLTRSVPGCGADVRSRRDRPGISKLGSAANVGVRKTRIRPTPSLERPSWPTLDIL